MRIICYMSLLWGALFIASCNLASHSHFTAYMNKPFNSSKDRIKLNGVYFIADYSLRHGHSPILFFLYSDGSVNSSFATNMSAVGERNFWTNEAMYLKNLKMGAIGSEGHFWIKDGYIYFQLFDINPGALFPINSIEFNGRISNDSTFILSNTICTWCDWKPISGYSLEYKFYATEIRPDSSSMWFKKKRWYKDKVWNRDERGS
ncbi:MAG: hypothetical protein KF775_00175 [Cyclobacteriaceae bacterium]|nr:hypothetical protein [Cyclobacteriaceae bacterium]